MELALAIVTLLVGIAIFITGMNMMSSGLKKIAGKGVRKLFKKVSNSSVTGLGIGALVTAIIQSSAATSVMVIGFLNAGVMSIFLGVSIMMGAYIGTTMTGILVSFSSFSFSEFLVLFAVVGVILMFFKNPRIKYIGEIFTGLGLVFFGLSTMSGSLKGNADIVNALTTLFTNVSFPLLVFMLGILFSVLMQSSSAVTGVAIVLAGTGAMPFASALYVGLGATVGTLITTLIATIGANRDAKRATTVVLFIKLISGFLGLIITWIFEAPLTSFFESSFGSLQLGIAMFLLFFNVIFMFVLLPLIKPLVNLSEKLVPDKELENKKKDLLYIQDSLLRDPNIALIEAKQEIIHMLTLSKENFIEGFNFLVNAKEIDRDALLKKEESIDFINGAIANYLVKISEKVNIDDAPTVGSYFHVINDIERIGDHAYNYYKARLDMIDKELEFSSMAKGELNNFFDIIMKMFDLAYDIFDKEDTKELPILHELEDKTDNLNREYASNHFKRIQNKECTNELSPYFSNCLTELERVSDHLTNIGYSIVDITGKDD